MERSSPDDVRRLIVRFTVLVIVPVIGLVGFGVMAISNERAAVEKRFQEQYGGRLRALASHLVETIDDDASHVSDQGRSPRVSFRFRSGPAGLESTPAQDAERSRSLETALLTGAPPLGMSTILSVPRGPARGLYAVRRDPSSITGIAFDVEALARSVTEEGLRRFPTDAAHYTLDGPREPADNPANPIRRLLNEITAERAEASPLSFPLPPPLTDWRISGVLASDDPVRSALWRNRTIYIVALSLFYVIIAVGVVVTLRGFSRELRLSRLKSDFVSNISHELRTPLTSIRMFAETLKLGRAVSPEEQAACIDVIFHESERLGRLAERTLEWARIEEGRRAFAKERISPGPWLHGVTEAFLARGALPREHLSIRIDPDLPELEGDAGALDQVVLNLLENAVKYTPLEKRIELRLLAARRKVMLEVHDNGIGISRSDLKRIFERFYRADDLLARKTEGTGLGLSIARRIVEAHGGRLRVESVLGKGSTFTVELPAARTARTPAPQEGIA